MKRYNSMEKIFAMLLSVTILLALFAGCSKPKEGTAGTISEFESQAHIQVSTPEDASGEPSGDTSKAPLSGEFVVSEKKYDYNDANLELLYVENQTDRNYDITIHGVYLDENGETIEEETQTFEGFASGWSNHFIFYPRKAFDSFKYTVDMVEASGVTKVEKEQIKTVDKDGVPLVSYLTEFTYENELRWERGISSEIDPDARREIRDLVFIGHAFCRPVSTEIEVFFNLLILDENGEIYITNFDYRDSDYAAVSRNAAAMMGGSFTEGYSAIVEGAEIGTSQVILKAQEKGEDETIPDTVQGKFTAIFAVTQVFDWTDWCNHDTFQF